MTKTDVLAWIDTETASFPERTLGNEVNTRVARRISRLSSRTVLPLSSAQAETLLHELAHLIRPVTLYGPNGPLAGLNLPDLFEEDFGTAQSSAAQKQNARTLLANCQKFIETFPK